MEKISDRSIELAPDRFKGRKKDEQCKHCGIEDHFQKMRDQAGG